MSTMYEDVKQFHICFGHPILDNPTIPHPNRQVLRAKLLRDEYVREFVPAWDKCAQLKKGEPASLDQDLLNDYGEEYVTALAELGDVIADLIYYLIGTSLEYGLPLPAIWAAVQQSNMSKLWTYEEVGKFVLPDGWYVKPIDILLSPGKTEEKFVMYDETGKVRKPPSWREPDIKAIVRAAMQGGG